LIGRLLSHPLLRNPDLVRLSASSACNSLGMTGEQVILGLLVFQITQSSDWVGVALALYYLPLSTFGPLSGALADAMDRRHLLRAIEFAIAVNLAVFATLIAFDLAELWLVLVITLASGCLRAAYGPARTSYAYDLVGGGRIVSGLGLINLTTRLGQLVGALAAGAVMQRYGTPAALLGLVGAHAIALAILFQLRTVGEAKPDDDATTDRQPIRKNLSEYLAEMRSNRVLLMLILVTASVEVFGFSFTTALPEMAQSSFEVGAEGLGVMYAARAAGGTMAGLALTALGTFQRRGLVFLGVIYLFGVSLMLVAAADQFELLLAALFAVAALATASDVLTQAMVQLSVPDKLRGRAMGAWSLAIGSAPLGHLEMGALIVGLGLTGALMINGVALIAVGILVTIMVPKLRLL
jgi:predicted MFS family arabinose efflux permease